MRKVWISPDDYHALEKGELVLEAQCEPPVLVEPVSNRNQLKTDATVKRDDEAYIQELEQQVASLTKQVKYMKTSVHNLANFISEENNK